MNSKSKPQVQQISVYLCFLSRFINMSRLMTAVKAQKPDD